MRARRVGEMRCPSVTPSLRYAEGSDVGVGAPRDVGVQARGRAAEFVVHRSAFRNEIPGGNASLRSTFKLGVMEKDARGTGDDGGRVRHPIHTRNGSPSGTFARPETRTRHPWDIRE